LQDNYLFAPINSFIEHQSNADKDG